MIKEGAVCKDRVILACLAHSLSIAQRSRLWRGRIIQCIIQLVISLQIVIYCATYSSLDFGSQTIIISCALQFKTINKRKVDVKPTVHNQGTGNLVLVCISSQSMGIPINPYTQSGSLKKSLDKILSFQVQKFQLSINYSVNDGMNDSGLIE